MDEETGYTSDWAGKRHLWLVGGGFVVVVSAIALLSTGMFGRYPAGGVAAEYYPVRVSLPSPTALAGRFEVETAQPGFATDLTASDIEARENGEDDSAADATQQTATLGNSGRSRIGADFLDQPGNSDGLQKVKMTSEGLMAVDFDLGTGSATAGNSASAIDISKPVDINGKAAGRIGLKIDGRSTILASTSQLRALIAAQGDAVPSLPSGEGGFATFNALRKAGLDVRYDAGRDRIVVTTS